MAGRHLDCPSRGNANIPDAWYERSPELEKRVDRGRRPRLVLRRILGLGFGLAMVFGGTVGVGILRLPGTLAAALGDSKLIVTFWILGGAYALLGAVSVSELAAMLPQAGGFYVYARRAFGNGVGFAVGWADWINNVATLAYAPITAMVFLIGLWPSAAPYAKLGAVLLLASFTALHWVGLTLGSRLTRLISCAIGLMMLTVVIGCFWAPAAPRAGAALPMSVASLPLLSLSMAAALVAAFRAVLLTYDGWYAPIYLAEENTEPARTLPRALIGGTLVLIALYVMINLAFLRVLPLPVLAASALPAADAARAVFPRGGAAFVTVISLSTVLGLINAVMLMAPRVLLAIGRDGFFTPKAAAVSAGGTPRLALALSSAVAAALILSGTFEQIIALATILFLLIYIATYIAVFVLRRREPETPRPYRAFGFPFTTGIVCLGCVLVLFAAVIEDPRSAGAAGGLFLACVPVYAWIAWRRRREHARAASAAA
jgi:APA family basic amino acid/polyamine antiporter